MQCTPSCRGPAALPLQWLSDPKLQLLQRMIDMRSCQTNWALATRIIEAAWTMQQVHIPFRVGDPVLLGTFGTTCGERKRNVVSIVVNSRWCKVMSLERSWKFRGSTIYQENIRCIHIHYLWLYYNWFGSNLELSRLKKCRRISMERRFWMVSLKNQITLDRCSCHAKSVSGLFACMCQDCKAVI